MLDVALIFVTFLLLAWWWMSVRSQKGQPPGVGLALPLIGHLYMLDNDPTKQFQEWRKKFGDVFSVLYGTRKVVFINGYDTICEALVKQHTVFMNRSDSFLHCVLFNNAGVISVAGEEWKEQRSFLQSTLRSLGVGSNVMAEGINTEIGILLEEMASAKGQPMSLRYLLSASLSNIISCVTFGRRFDYHDPHFVSIQEHTARAFELASPSSPFHFFYRLIRYIPGHMFHYWELQDYISAMKADFVKFIRECETQDLGHDETTATVIGAYMAEMRKKGAYGDIGTSLNEKNMLYSAWNLFNAGTETSSTTLLFGVLYMINFPDIQEKLYEEIKDVVGTDKPPTLAHKPSLKYVNAFIMETQRFSSLIPLSIDRDTDRDTTLNGLFIPKNTTVIPVLDSLMWDEKVWGDPMNFRPERFLENGVITIKKEFLPFSVGRRNCLGEPLAVMQLYLFMTAFIQRFQFLPEDPNNIPPLEGSFGFSRTPKPFNVRAIIRS